MAPGNTVNLGGGAPGGGGPGGLPIHKLPPLPVMAVIVGGGLGGTVFLYQWFRKGQTQTAQGTPSSPQQVQASVPVMLGSLQQSLLDLEGQVGSGVSGLTSAVTANQAATTAGIANAATGLAGNMTTNQGILVDLIHAQGSSFADLLSKRADALQAVLDALGTQVTQVGAGNDALSVALHQAFLALQGDLSAVQSDISTVNQTVGGVSQQVTGVAGQVSAVGSQLTGVGGQLSQVVQGQAGLSLQQSTNYFQALGNSYLGQASVAIQTSPLGKDDPRVLQLLQAAQNAFTYGAQLTPSPYPAQPF